MLQSRLKAAKCGKRGRRGCVGHFRLGAGICLAFYVAGLAKIPGQACDYRVQGSWGATPVPPVASFGVGRTWYYTTQHYTNTA